MLLGLSKVSPLSKVPGWLLLSLYNMLLVLYIDILLHKFEQANGQPYVFYRDPAYDVSRNT